jgi:excisionase family DNA binding protein
MEKYLSRQDVAEVFGVSDKTVQRWVSRGLLKGSHLGNRTVRYRPADVEALFDHFAEVTRDDGWPASNLRNGSASAKGNCTQWSIGRGKPCVCGMHS